MSLAWKLRRRILGYLSPIRNIKLIGSSAPRRTDWGGGSLRIPSYHTRTSYFPSGRPDSVGVQWHPEGFWNQREGFQALFDALVAAAR